MFAVIVTVSCFVALLALPMVTDALGVNGDGFGVDVVPPGIPALAIGLIYRRIAMNRLRARDEEDEIAMSRIEHAIEEYRREQESASD